MNFRFKVPLCFAIQTLFTHESFSASWQSFYISPSHATTILYNIRQFHTMSTLQFFITHYFSKKKQKKLANPWIFYSEEKLQLIIHYSPFPPLKNKYILVSFPCNPPGVILIYSRDQVEHVSSSPGQDPAISSQHVRGFSFCCEVYFSSDARRDIM